MTNDKDPYDILGVPGTASLAEIKKRYRTLAKTMHPDPNPEADKAKWKDISRAYDELCKRVAQSEMQATKAAQAAREQADRVRKARAARAPTEAEAKAFGDDIRNQTGRARAGSTKSTGTTSTSSNAQPPPPLRTPPPFTWPYGVWPPPPFTPPRTPPHSSGSSHAAGNPTSPSEPKRRGPNPVLSALITIFQFIAGAIAAVAVGFIALWLWVAVTAALLLGALWLVVELLGFMFTGHFFA